MTVRTVSFVVWAALAAVVVGCQLTAIASRGRLPKVEALVQVATGGVVQRGLVVLGWMWLGWHAFAR